MALQKIKGRSLSISKEAHLEHFQSIISNGSSQSGRYPAVEVFGWIISQASDALYLIQAQLYLSTTSTFSKADRGVLLSPDYPRVVCFDRTESHTVECIQQSGSRPPYRISISHEQP